MKSFGVLIGLMVAVLSCGTAAPCMAVGKTLAEAQARKALADDAKTNALLALDAEDDARRDCQDVSGPAVSARGSAIARMHALGKTLQEQTEALEGGDAKMAAGNSYVSGNATNRSDAESSMSSGNFQLNSMYPMAIYMGGYDGNYTVAYDTAGYAIGYYQDCRDRCDNNAGRYDNASPYYQLAKIEFDSVFP